MYPYIQNTIGKLMKHEGMPYTTGIWIDILRIVIMYSAVASPPPIPHAYTDTPIVVTGVFLSCLYGKNSAQASQS